jgi:hypothetical protein
MFLDTIFSIRHEINFVPPLIVSQPTSPDSHLGAHDSNFIPLRYKLYWTLSIVDLHTLSIKLTYIEDDIL